jgi:hypothetical protein
MKRVMASEAFSRRSPAAVRPSVSGMRASHSASANGPGVGSAMPTLVSSRVRRVSRPLLVASDLLSVVAKLPFAPFGPTTQAADDHLHVLLRFVTSAGYSARSSLARRSPNCSPTSCRGDNVRAQRRLSPIARQENVCPKSSFPTGLAGLNAP